ncbi:MAG TPA: mechanosensitive ion channel family protein [Opitutaceae bacterium]
MTLDQLWKDLASLLPGFLTALPVAAVVILGGFLVNVIIGRALRLLAARTSLTPADVAPARNVLRWLVRVITAVIVLGVFGFELGGLWAMISTVLAMIAIGFVAVWSMLSNTSATVLLVLLRPFRVGDDLELPSEGVHGRVIDLNFFFTTLVDHDGREWRVPNNLFFQKVVRRTAGSPAITLAAQLNSSTPAQVGLPPPPPAKDSESRKPVPASEDFAAKSIPDPATLTPKK